MTESYLDRFLAAYIECALWAETDNADEAGGEPLDRNYGPDDIAPGALEQMRADCAEFIALAGMIPRIAWTPEQGGHDFWLTRNGHGAGFWDRGEPDGNDLARYADTFGPCDIYVGEDGRLYV